MEKNIKKECIYVYNWITLLDSRNEHNIVNQLDFNKINFFKKGWYLFCSSSHALENILFPIHQEEKSHSLIEGAQNIFLGVLSCMGESHRSYGAELEEDTSGPNKVNFLLGRRYPRASKHEGWQYFIRVQHISTLCRNVRYHNPIITYISSLFLELWLP